MNKKTVYKILSILMIFAIVLTTANISSYAVQSTDTTTLVIEGLEAGVSVTAYRLATVSVDNTSGQLKEPEYVWEDSVLTWLQTKSNGYTAYEDPEDFSEVTDTETLETFYSALAAAIKGNSITISTYYTGEADGDDATYPVETTHSATIDGVDMGLYLVIIENGYMIYTPSAVSVVPEHDGTSWNLAETFSVNVKSTTPTISKSVTSTSTTVDNYSTIDTINYTITANVPNYAENSIYTTYKITDELSGGLVLDTSSVVVSVVKNGTSSKLVAGEDYTITTSSTKFTVDFLYSSIDGYDEVEITYTAKLSQNSSTVIGGTGNENTATLIWSNNPYSDTTKSTESPEDVTVYTYGIEITKLNSSDEALKGATFNLKDSSGNVLTFVESDGIYYLSTGSSAEADLVSNSSGLITIYGLDEGTYILQETKAPEDYLLDTEEEEIVISDGELDGTLDVNDKDGDGVYELTWYNSSSFSLPVTGGVGTTIFIIVGICLIIMGVILKIKLNKKEENITEK